MTSECQELMFHNPKFLNNKLIKVSAQGIPLSSVGDSQNPILCMPPNDGAAPALDCHKAVHTSSKMHSACAFPHTPVLLPPLTSAGKYAGWGGRRAEQGKRGQKWAGNGRIGLGRRWDRWPQLS